MITGFTGDHSKHRPMPTPVSRSPSFSLLVFTTGCAAVIAAQAVPAQVPRSQPATPAKAWTAADDHRQMMGQLGLTALRPGYSGNEQDPSHANYDEALANPSPFCPKRSG
jgi:hypothetical protein